MMRTRLLAFSAMTALALGSGLVLDTTGASTPALLAAGPWYVSPSGSDGGTCLSPADPCATIGAAVGLASSGDQVLVAVGLYDDEENPLLIDESVDVLGGWDDQFGAQTARSIIRSSYLRIGPGVVASLDRLELSNNLAGTVAAIFSSGQLTVSRSEIHTNDSHGIQSSGPGLELIESTVRDNGDSAVLADGGPVQVVASTISGNARGGIRMQNPSAGTRVIEVISSTISGNRGGPGISSIVDETLIIAGSTITNNSGGLWPSVGGVEAEGSVDVRNTIVAGNTNDRGEADWGPGPAPPEEDNLIGGDPELGPLADNGGPTRTHELLFGSPAVGAGHPGVPGSGRGSCEATDQRGVERPQGTRCDIGAFERTHGSYGEYTAVTPARVLDTRTGNGRSGLVGELGENRSFGVQITGRGGVAASGVAAVVMNVTVTEPTAPSYLTVWPSGADLPTVSNLNYVAGQTVPNLVTVAVGDDGRVQAFNRFGSTHVIFDVVGFYADFTGPEGSRFHAIDPYRYFDTRTGRGGVDLGPRGPNSVLRFNAFGKGGVPSSGVTAVVMNVTVTEPTLPSFLTVYPDDVAARPLASNLNFVPGQTVPNLVTVKVPASGIIDFYNLQGNVHVIADVVGYYSDDESTEAGRFVGFVPYRHFDSRDITNDVLGPDEDWVVGNLPGFGGILLGEVESVVLNVTVTEPTEPSFLTVFPSDLCDIPLASNLNFVAGQTVPNHVIVRLGTDSGCSEPQWLETISVYNRFGNVYFILDIFGAFSAPTTTLFG